MSESCKLTSLGAVAHQRRPRFIFIGMLVAAVIFAAAAPNLFVDGPTPLPPGTQRGQDGWSIERIGPQTWFATYKAQCNWVEIDDLMRRHPPDLSKTGRVGRAACYALAGRFDVTRQWLLETDPLERPSLGTYLWTIDEREGTDAMTRGWNELYAEFKDDFVLVRYRALLEEDYDRLVGWHNGRYVATALTQFLEKYGRHDRYRAEAQRRLAQLHRPH